MSLVIVGNRSSLAGVAEEVFSSPRFQSAQQFTKVQNPVALGDQPDVVYIAPHSGLRMAHKIGVMQKAAGEFIADIPAHRVYDLHLAEFIKDFSAEMVKIAAKARRKVPPIVSFFATRLFANAAVHRHLAFASTTPDGVEIPVFTKNKNALKRAREAAYDFFIYQLDKNKGGNNDAIVVSIDSFDPDHQKGDEGARDSVICLIVKRKHGDVAENLRNVLQEKMAGLMIELKEDSGFPQIQNDVAINGHPYGKNMIVRLIADITVDMCSSLLEKDGMRQKMAAIVSESLFEVLHQQAKPKPAAEATASPPRRVPLAAGRLAF